MIRIGLTGSIGAGKSTVSAILRELGAPVIDADAISRDITQNDASLLEKIRKEFGNEVFQQDGKLDRGKMAELVFSDTAKREKLENMLHPRIISRMKEMEYVFDKEDFVVFDVPLLFETGMNKQMDIVWVVDADKEIRIGRLAERNGMSRSEAENRIKAQLSDEKKRAHADLIIENNGTHKELKRKIECLWKSINA